VLSPLPADPDLGWSFDVSRPDAMAALTPGLKAIVA